MASSLKSYLSLIKFSHTIFAMPFALIGFSLGVLYENKPFEGRILIAVVLCMVFARSAAMAFNRYIDERFDKLNPRTAVREIPAGVIQKNNALFFVVVMCGLFILTTFFINRICFYLSPVALFVILFYSYTKRFTALCHLVLGVGLALAPLGAFLAVTGYFTWLPILFSALVLCWVSGFDILYALQDEDFDKAHQLHSIPSLLGRRNALHVSTLLHLIAGLLVIGIGVLASSGWIYWIGALAFIGLLIYQHTLVKPHDISKVNIAFATTNGIASMVYAVFVILSLWV
ncbi:MAG: UbiA family prenyltransferase [Chitinophagaceae bacterium]|nr:UbiA family prenyltransferase [Chitinophagaceae bacterium]